VHYIEGFDVSVDVVYNDKINLEQVKAYDKIVLSPGPGLPQGAGKLMELIAKYHKSKPILGVCLGFQALIEFYDGRLYNQEFVKHGVAEYAKFNQASRLFENTADEFKIGLYHSWAAQESSFPRELLITGKSENNVIMAFEHVNLPIAGVQFHPESILSEHGYKIVENFIFNFK
jgi:anthranilate synthase/aminodeoxychorismate synthase-like glutamine amidotransferase